MDDHRPIEASRRRSTCYGLLSPGVGQPAGLRAAVATLLSPSDRLLQMHRGALGVGEPDARPGAVDFFPAPRAEVLVDLPAPVRR